MGVEIFLLFVKPQTNILATDVKYRILCTSPWPRVGLKLFSPCFNGA